MAAIVKSIRINAPVSRVFDYLTTPENLPEIWPSLIEVSDVHRTPDGSHGFDWVYKMVGMRFKGHAETVEVARNERVVVKNEKGIPSTFYWSYAERDGQTELSVEIDYDLPAQLLNKLAEALLSRINEQEAETLLNNLKARLELESGGAGRAA